MLIICSSFAVSHKLEFNSVKTQLMCSCCPSVYPITADLYLNNIKLSFVSHVKHLGHILSSNLDDTLDIQRVVKDLNCKAKQPSLHISFLGSSCHDFSITKLLFISVWLLFVVIKFVIYQCH